MKICHFCYFSPKFRFENFVFNRATHGTLSPSPSFVEIIQWNFTGNSIIVSYKKSDSSIAIIVFLAELSEKNLLGGAGIYPPPPNQNRVESLRYFVPISGIKRMLINFDLCTFKGSFYFISFPYFLINC